ncbi:DEAD/DEAH box helicase [Halosegnis marinus]|uniref:Putative DNA 3'-5' helicase Rad25 n=1 Tax=Halosegnis marinus TaxID=3034023 RepID=A0ABD5ZL86_9EURY
MTDSDGGPDEGAAPDADAAPDTRDGDAPDLTLDAFYDALESAGRPLLTATELSRLLDCTQTEALAALEALAGSGRVESADVEADPTVWFPTDYKETADRERIVVFPGRRQVVVDAPSQFTRAQLSQFAHLEDANREHGYVYEVREEDVWAAPYDDFAGLERTMRQALGERNEALEEWVKSQWERARKFRLRSHEDGYTVLEARNADLLGNIAERELDEGQLRARISDTEAWVAEESVAAVKRALYEAGYPVLDTRHLDTGEALPLDLRVDLRDYQHEWVNRFVEKRSGILVGPPGSGKTVAAMGVMSAIEGETLILVPGRELAAQWKETILEHTSLADEQVGEYHGGKKEIRPVTVATYQTAGMDRHRHLFDDRKWGLIVYDEVHHIPSPIHRRSADLQAKHRLGLSATPIREDDKQKEIFTLVGPPIGTNWAALFDAGYVAEPEIEIRTVPWADDESANAYADAAGHERRQAAAENPAKIRETRAILRDHPGAKALIFVEYIAQGEAFAEALSIPFVSGEMPHARRRKLFDEFRNGPRDALVVSRVGDEGIDLPNAEIAVAASGLGGSRRQGAQRAGRTMRPVGKARMYVLATRGTEEEDFARSRTRHLQGKGIRVREREAETLDPGDRTGDDRTE